MGESRSVRRRKALQVTREGCVYSGRVRRNEGLGKAGVESSEVAGAVAGEFREERA